MKSFHTLLLTLALCSYSFAEPALETSSVLEEVVQVLPQEMENILQDAEVDEEISALEEELKRDLDDLGIKEGLETVSHPISKAIEEDAMLSEVPASDTFELPIAEKELPSPVQMVPEIALNSQEIETPATLEIVKESSAPVFSLNLAKAFSGSPTIYLILLALSMGAVTIWLYSMMTLEQAAKASTSFVKTLQAKLLGNQFDEALFLCQQNSDILSKMVTCGIHCRGGSLSSLVEAMRTEGKRASIHFWQRIGLLNDIAIIAPMIGLLGTVLGMFYAFYDLNRSIESITTLFDGLGVSVGTTVAGLVVAILALVLHSIAKYRLVRVLARVENEAHTFAALLHHKTI